MKGDSADDRRQVSQPSRKISLRWTVKDLEFDAVRVVEEDPVVARTYPSGPSNPR